ncbi:MAG: hypothetical protein H7145_24925 [Akkermansiaceae bacterium]|nr:hypothetical protein [Armatimonadota bacterium]
MPVYSHYNLAKKQESLPMAEQIGVCLTCSYWQAETPRPQEQVEMEALCVQPQLKAYGLIVSGASACNKWQKQEGSGDQAEQYAKQNEAQA